MASKVTVSGMMCESSRESYNGQVIMSTIDRDMFEIEMRGNCYIGVELPVGRVIYLLLAGMYKDSVMCLSWIE